MIVARRRAAAGRARRRARLPRHRRLPGRRAPPTSTRCPGRGRRWSRGDEAELIRRHETLEDVFARDLIPERLRAGCRRPRGAGAWRATGLDHVSVTSGDLDRSLGFYCDLLGLELRARGEATGARSSRSPGSPTPASAGRISELPHGQVLELIEYVEPRGAPSRPQPNDPGATHISLRVADVDAVYEPAAQRRRAVWSASRSKITSPGAWKGARVFYSSDPDGVSGGADPAGRRERMSRRRAFQIGAACGGADRCYGFASAVVR